MLIIDDDKDLTAMSPSLKSYYITFANASPWVSAINNAFKAQCIVQ